jgi:hypothetical protein
MTNSRRSRPAADVAVGYAADAKGKGIAYAAINTGSAMAIVRLPFSTPPVAALEGLDAGYAAIAAVGTHLKSRGVARVRIRTADARIVADLNGAGSPPKALAMAYVKIRCVLHGLGPVRLELAESVEIRDLTARARAEINLHAAA